MPILLQEKSEFSHLGHLEADFSGNKKLPSDGNDSNSYMKLIGDQSLNSRESNHGSQSCGCLRHDRILGQGRVAAPENVWSKLVHVFFFFFFPEIKDGRVLASPKLDHLHLNGNIESLVDLQVIFYEMPAFGGHHSTLGVQLSSSFVTFPSKKPKRFDDLQQRDAHLDLDAVMWAINRANAAQILFDGHHHAVWNTSPDS